MQVAVISLFTTLDVPLRLLQLVYHGGRGGMFAHWATSWNPGFGRIVTKKHHQYVILITDTTTGNLVFSQTQKKLDGHKLSTGMLLTQSVPLFNCRIKV